MSWTMKPHPLVDAVRVELAEPSDTALSVRLGFSERHMAHIRGQFKKVSDELLLSIHEETGWSFDHLRSLVPAEQLQHQGTHA